MIEVAPARLGRWCEGFVQRHGPSTYAAVEGRLRLDAQDGSHAECTPLLEWDPAGPASPADFARHVCVTPPLVLLLLRRGGYAVGMLESGKLAASKVGSRYVQSRTAAGGWSQQRFARRRENQASALLDAAAQAAVKLIAPEGRGLPKNAVVVTGGDRALAERLLADRRLTALAGWAGLAHPRHLDVPDPRADVLRKAALSAVAVRIDVQNA